MGEFEACKEIACPHGTMPYCAWGHLGRGVIKDRAEMGISMMNPFKCGCVVERNDFH